METGHSPVPAIPDWQLPEGVDRGLWAYLHASEMVVGYDDQIRTSTLATADVSFCEKAFAEPGRLINLGCGTGRLSTHFARKGFDCLGVDLSDDMLAKARENWESTPRTETSRTPTWLKANLVDLSELPSQSTDFAACLFSTLGMVRGSANRARVIENAFRLLRPGGRFVLHAHNRYYRGLGWTRVLAQAFRSLFGSGGDIAMPQAYGGPPLTLHHFSWREITSLLVKQGFQVLEVLPLGEDGRPAWPFWHVYGWLILCQR